MMRVRGMRVRARAKKLRKEVRMMGRWIDRWPLW